MAKKAFISLTGGLNDVDRPDTLGEDQLQECVNYEIAGVGRLKKRTDPSVYDTDLNTLLAEVFPDGVNSISEPFYPPVKPEDMTGDFIILVDGVSGEDRLVEAFYEGDNGWIYQDENGDSFFNDINIPFDLPEVNYTIAGNQMLAASKELPIISISVDAVKRRLLVRRIGTSAPINKPILFDGNVGGDYDYSSGAVSYSSNNEGVGSPGLIQCQYTVVDIYGNESNPSPLSSTLFAQAFIVGDDGVSDESFIDNFQVKGLSIPDVATSVAAYYRYFNIYFRVLRYSDGTITDSMEFSSQQLISNSTFAVYDTGNDYSIDTPKVAGKNISYEKDESISPKTVGWNGGIVMAGNISSKAGSLRNFGYVCPITLRNNSSNVFIDKVVRLRLNWNDIKNSLGDTVIPEWSEWFDNTDVSAASQYPSSYKGIKWRDETFSRHIRFYAADQVTPLIVLVPDEYSAEGDLDFYIRMPVISGGSDVIYLAWNDITDNTLVFENIGFNEKFNLLPVYSDDGYWIDTDIDSNRYGWYNNIAYNYGRFGLSSAGSAENIRSTLLYSNDYVRDGGSEFIGNFHSRNFPTEKIFEGESLVATQNIEHLPNMANSKYPAEAINTMEARPVLGIAGHQMHRTLLGDSADDVSNKIGQKAFRLHIAEINASLVNLDDYLYSPRLGVSTADSSGHLKVNNVDMTDESFLLDSKEEWLDIGFHIDSNIRSYQPVLRDAEVIYSGWAGENQDIQLHSSLGSFIPATGGYAMGDLARNIGKIPDNSFMRMQFSFRISDLVQYFNNKLSGITNYGGIEVEPLIDTEGWGGGYYAPTVYSYFKSTTVPETSQHATGEAIHNTDKLNYYEGRFSWDDWVLFHWSAGVVDRDNTSGTWGNVLGGVEESPIHNRGILLLEIRRTGTTSTTINPSTQQYEMLLTYAHYGDNSYDDNKYTATGMPQSKVRQSIVLSSEFTSTTERSFTYTGDDEYKHLDIILSTDMLNDKCKLYCLDKKFEKDALNEIQETSFSLTEFIAGGYSNGTASVNGTDYYKAGDSYNTSDGGATILQNSWQSKSFYDMGIGISKDLNIINKVDVGGSPATLQPGNSSVGYNSLWETEVNHAAGEDINFRPTDAQLFIRYSAAQGFYRSFEFNSAHYIDSKERAYEIFGGLPFKSNIGVTSVGKEGSSNNIEIGVAYENLFRSSENTLRWSDIDGTSFPDLNYKILKEPIKKIIAAPSFLQFEYSNTFLIFTRNTINRFVLKGDPSGWSGSSDSLIEENTQFGLYADNTLVKVGKEIFWLSEEGVVRWNAEGMVNISKNVINLGDADGLYDADLYRAMYCPVRNQYILQYTDGNQSFVYDLTYRMWTTFTKFAFGSSAILSGGSQAENVNLILNGNEIFSYPGLGFTQETAYIKTKDMFLDAGKVDRVRLQYIGGTNATLTYQLNGESRNGDAYSPREHTISGLKANVWRGAGNLGFGRMANIKVEDVEELHSIMFDVKLKGGE